MRSYSWLLLLSVIITVSSCNKKDADPAANVNPPVTQPVGDYTIKGVHDIDVFIGDEYDLPVELQFLSGGQSQVTLRIAGLPAGVNAAILQKSGTPPFITVIRFVVDKTAPAATYPIQIVATGTAMKDKAIDLNLTVKADSLISLYGAYNCTSDSMIYVDSVARSGVPGKIVFRNFFGMGQDVLGNVDLANHSIDIPVQQIDLDYPGRFITANASGVFNDDTIKLYFTATVNSIGTPYSDTLLMVR